MDLAQPTFPGNPTPFSLGIHIAFECDFLSSNIKFPNYFILIASDIVIGETSGLLTTAIYLNKKIIFIEPGRQFDWSTSDIEKKIRPGYVCRTFDDLLGATSSYIIKDEFVKQRAEFNDRVFYNKEINAYSQLRSSILQHIAK